MAPRPKRIKKTSRPGSLLSGVKKVGKGAWKVARVGSAAVRLTAKMINPINVAKMAHGAATGKGLVLPGSKYIGPGNPMNLGKPTSKSDANARLHDLDYDKLLERGVKPSKLYLGFSEADERLMKRSNVTTPLGLATYGGMAVKKGLYKLGLTGEKIKG